MNKVASVSLVLANIAIMGGVVYHINVADHDHNRNGQNVEVVVSQYDEGLSWVEKARFRDSNVRYTVYSKNSNPPKGTVHLPNVGRESQTFLYHIVKNYNKLADWTVFTQAATPNFGFMANNKNSGHMCSGVTFDDYLEPKADGWYEVQTVATRYPEMWHSDRFDMMFQIPTSRGDVCPAKVDEDDYAPSTGWSMWWKEDDHPLLKKQETDKDFVPPIEFYNRLIVADASASHYDTFTVNYANGGRFAVSRDRIQMRPVSYYKNLLHELSKNVNPIEGYYMETMWYDVFHPDRLQAEYGPACNVPAFPKDGATNHAIMFDEAEQRHKNYLVETYGSEENAPRGLQVSSPYIITPEPQCVDVPDWHDADGAQFNCEWYAQENNCHDYGTDFPNVATDGNWYTAKGACCACGGGLIDGSPAEPTESTCYRDADTVIYGCECHSSCGTCGYGENPDATTNCLTCNDGEPVTPIWEDGTGVCLEAGCYDKDADDNIIKVDNCSCHETCKACGFGYYADADDCLTCADNGPVNEVYVDGSGTCGAI